MTPSTGVQPWYLAYFLVVWVVAMTYVAAFFATVLRIRRVTGESTGPDDWLVVLRDRTTVRYLRWVFSGQHRTAGEPTLSRMVVVVRILFLIALPAVLGAFALIPLGALPAHHGAEANFVSTP